MNTEKAFFVGKSNAASDTFLGDATIQKAVSSICQMVGFNIAKLKKDKIEDDYDNTDPAFKAGKPLVQFGFITMSVMGSRVIPNTHGNYPIIELDIIHCTSGEKDVLTICPADYFYFEEGMTDAQIFKQLDQSRGAELFNRIFPSPFAAARTAQVLNRAEVERAKILANRYNNALEVMGKIQIGIDSLFEGRL